MLLPDYVSSNIFYAFYFLVVILFLPVIRKGLNIFFSIRVLNSAPKKRMIMHIYIQISRSIKVVRLPYVYEYLTIQVMYREYSSENKNHPILAINAPGISSIICFFLFGINVYITEKNKVSKAGTKNSLFEKIAFITMNFPPRLARRF